jgi:hypothetical protein
MEKYEKGIWEHGAQKERGKRTERRTGKRKGINIINWGPGLERREMRKKEDRERSLNFHTEAASMTFIKVSYQTDD